MLTERKSATITRKNAGLERQLFVSLLVVLPCTAFPQEHQIQDLRVIFDHHASLVRSIQFDYTRTITYHEPDADEKYKDGSIDYERYRRKGDRKFRIRKTAQGNPIAKVGFDGITSYLLQVGNVGGVESYGMDQLTIHSEESSRIDGFSSPIWFMGYVGDMLGITPLKDVIETFNVQQDMASNWIELRGNLRERCEVVLSFDPEKEYALVKCRSFQDGRKLIDFEISEFQTATISGEILYIPVLGQVTAYEFWDSERRLNTEEIKVTSFEVNEDYPDESFIPKPGPSPSFWGKFLLYMGFSTGAINRSKPFVQPSGVVAVSANASGTDTIPAASKPRVVPSLVNNSDNVQVSKSEGKRWIRYGMIPALAAVVLAVLIFRRRLLRR